MELSAGLSGLPKMGSRAGYIIPFNHAPQAQGVIPEVAKHDRRSLQGLFMEEAIYSCIAQTGSAAKMFFKTTFNVAKMKITSIF